MVELVNQCVRNTPWVKTVYSSSQDPFSVPSTELRAGNKSELVTESHDWDRSSVTADFPRGRGLLLIQAGRIGS